MSKMLAPLTYKLMESGVQRSDGAFIPNSISNRDWRQYQEWLAEGNTPDPQFTEQEIIDNAQNEEISELRANLRNAMTWQFRMILEIWKALKAKGLVSNADVDPEVLAKAQDWAIKLNRLKELGDN